MRRPPRAHIPIFAKMPVLKRAYLVLSLIILGGIGGLLFMTIRYNQLFVRSSGWVRHTTVVLDETQKALTGLHEFETGSGKIAPIVVNVVAIRDLTTDNPLQLARIDSVLRMLQSGPGVPGFASPIRYGNFAEPIRELLLRIQAEDTRLLDVRENDMTVDNRNLRTYILALLGVIFGLLCLSVYIILYNFSRRRQAEKDLRESENRFDLLVQQVRDYAIYMLDPKGKIMSWNQGAQAIKGYSAKEVMGKSFTMFYTDEEIANGEPALNLKMAAEEGRFESIGLRKRKDGSVFYADVLFTATHDDKRNLSGFIKITRDITGEIRVQEEMRHALKREKELNEMKSRFVTLASHEFKTPLSVILSSTNLIEKYSAPGQEPDRVRHIHRIKSNVNNLKQLLNDFLSVEKLEEGAVRNTPAPSNLEIIARDAILDMEGTLKDGQLIYLDVTGDTRPVNVDKQLLRNVLNNLLSNAIKYSNEDSPVRLIVAFNENTVQLSVVDRGIGIPAKEQGHLFERFFRAANTTGISGTGLGLSIVRRYLDLMGGTIAVQSETGKGSVFTVTLKADPVPAVTPQ
jgi:PAS domain S-box-containing protein